MRTRWEAVRTVVAGQEIRGSKDERRESGGALARMGQMEAEKQTRHVLEQAFHIQPMTSMSPTSPPASASPLQV